MVAQFEQLIGAAGDVRELEYISALHQTDMSQVRKDASIKGMYGCNLLVLTILLCIIILADDTA